MRRQLDLSTGRLAEAAGSEGDRAAERKGLPPSGLMTN
jgi:hypothetical protein